MGLERCRPPSLVALMPRSSLVGHVRDIDVEREAALQRLLQQPRDQRLRDARRSIEVAAAVRLHAQRERHGGQAEEPALDGRGHGTGVQACRRRDSRRR